MRRPPVFALLLLLFGRQDHALAPAADGRRGNASRLIDEAKRPAESGFARPAL
jgi:hypothetical protein